MIVIAAAVVAVAAIGGTMLIFSGDDSQDSSRRRFRFVSDPNLPNPEKQEPREIMAYIDSDKFRQLAPQQKMNYFRGSGRKIMEYQMDTYASLPQEERVEFLDDIIDRMDEMRPAMEQYRQQRQAQRALERENNPDAAQQNQQGRRGRSGRRTPDPARMRARRERGTPEQRATRRQFFTALRNRAEQRGIQTFGHGSRR